MAVLEAWANGSHPGADPRTTFAERIGEVGHVSVSFGDEDPPQLRLDLPDLVLQCVAQPGPDGLGLKAFWDKAIAIPATGSPAIKYDWYRNFIQFMLDHHWYHWFAWIISVGQTT